jgi:hypothetical protein
VTLRFESRELKPYAEPISKSDLKEGATYFFLNCEDEEMLIPVLQPVVFLGRNLEPGDQGRAYFQDLSSHKAGVRYGGKPDGEVASFFTGSEDELGHVFQFEKALDQLLVCSLRRKKHG